MPVRDPLNVVSHARAMLVEQIMALIGRSSPDPARYRRLLEGMEYRTLQRTWAAIVDGEEAGI
jgi:hypothetical protein